MGSEYSCGTATLLFVSVIIQILNLQLANMLLKPCNSEAPCLFALSYGMGVNLGENFSSDGKIGFA
jgi:hypothetical protein